MTDALRPRADARPRPRQSRLDAELLDVFGLADERCHESSLAMNRFGSTGDFGAQMDLSAD